MRTYFLVSPKITNRAVFNQERELLDKEHSLDFLALESTNLITLKQGDRSNQNEVGFITKG